MGTELGPDQKTQINETRLAKVEKPLGEIGADIQANKAGVAAEFGEEMTAEEHCKRIGQAVFEMATDGGEGEKYLAIYLEHDAFPNGMNECLLAFEQEKKVSNPDYDVTDEHPKRIAFVLKRGLQARAETKMVADEQAIEATAKEAAGVVEEKAAVKEASLETYREVVASLGEIPNTQKIGLLLSEEHSSKIPNSELVKLHALQSILTIADSVPQDAPIVRQRLNQLDFSNGVSDPVSFARSFLFDGPDSHLKSGVSDATQDAIAVQLGIVRHKFSAKTGGDVNDIYKKGIGTKMVRDPETGELREEPVHLEAGEDVEIREGQYIGLSDTNEPMMKIVGEHTYTSDLPKNPTDHDMTMYGLATQWLAKLNDVNMAEMFFPHSVMERGGGHIKLNMPDDFQRAQKLSQIFFGAMAGYNGELPRQTDLDKIPHLMQFQNEKGDAVLGDVNPDQMRADYQRQGIIAKDGTLDWDLFERMIAANRNGLYFGEEHFADNAKEDRGQR